MAIAVDSLVRVGEEFLTALAERDFARLERSLTPDVRVRELKPPGLAERPSSSAVSDAFRGWFGSAAEFEVLAAEAERLSDRLHIAYRLRVDDHPMRPGSGRQVVEQHLFCTVDAGRIAAADLLCSGFRPD